MNRPLKPETKILAVRKQDLRLQTRGNYIVAVSFASNKVIEMKNNRLLEEEQLKAYTAIELIHDKKILRIPIKQGSWQYGGQGNQLLKVFLSPEIKMTKEELNTFHLTT